MEMLNQSYDCGNEKEIYSYLFGSKVNDVVGKKLASVVLDVFILVLQVDRFSRSPLPWVCKLRRNILNLF